MSEINNVDVENIEESSNKALIVSGAVVLLGIIAGAGAALFVKWKKKRDDIKINEELIEMVEDKPKTSNAKKN